MMKSFNEFDRLYQELEQRSGYDASRIEILVKNSRDGRDLVGSLYFWAREFESQRAKHRFLPNVPDWFIERYSSYKENFESEVDRIYGGLSLVALFFEDVDGIPASEILQPGETRTATSVKPTEAAEAVDSMMRWVWDCEEGLREGVEAYEWFTETVGIDLAKIEERWEKLPRTLVPFRMERTAAEGAPGGLVDLLDDATKAYIFGLPAAAIAMCRAVCDRVLREFYFADEKGEMKSLKKMAVLAEKRFEHIGQLRLPFYIDKANEVMHRYNGGRLSEDELEAVRQFLATTKTLIERAPNRSSI